MMRLFAVSLLVFCSSIPSHAVWLEVTSLNLPCAAAGLNVTFTAGDFLPDGRTGWIAGTYRSEDGPRLAVLRTTDGRRSWSAVWTDTEAVPAIAVDFVDRDHGWLLTADNGVFRTENGGGSWTRERVHGPEPVLRDLQMVDATHGFIAGRVWRMQHAAVFAYDAGTREWTQCLSERPGMLDALSASTGGEVWAAGLDPEGLPIGHRRQTDTWSRMLIPSAVQDLHFVNRGTGFAACSSGRFFMTSDGGNTWHERETPVLSGLSDIHFSTPTQGFALSAAGGLMITTNNAGGEWAVERVPDGAASLLWDGARALVLTPRGLHVREVVGQVAPMPRLQPRPADQPALIQPLPGPFSPVRTWRAATELIELLRDETPRTGTGGGAFYLSHAAFLENGRHGWFLGRASNNLRVILRTDDSGRTWESISPEGPLPASPQGISFVNDRDGWIWGDMPVICRTRDGGATWQNEPLEGLWAGVIRSVHDLAMLSSEAGYAVADIRDNEADLLLRRMNAAAPWRSEGETHNFAKIAVIPPDYMWFGSSSRNLGAGTAPASLTPLMDLPEHYILQKLLPHDRTVGWALAVEATRILRTSDAGRSWVARSFATDPADYAIDAAIVGANECFILTRLGRVMHTGDGGRNWREVHRLPGPVEPYRASIDAFGAHLYLCAGSELWTTAPPPGPTALGGRPDPARPELATRLLSWSTEPGFSAGVGLSPGQANRETIFRVQWDRRNSKRPGVLTLQVAVTGAERRLLPQMRLRPADWWGMEESGAGDWGVGFTPDAPGTYEYCFLGHNQDGEPVVGAPTEWRTWRVE